MKRYIAILEIEDDVEIVGNIEAVANYTYRDNGTNYAYTESVEFKIKQESCDICEYATSGGCQYDDIAEVIPTEGKPCDDVFDKIRDEVCDIDDEIVLNPDSFWERKVYVRFSEVINIIDKYKAESEVNNG